MPKSLRDAAQAVSERVKGLDRADILRRVFAVWLAVTLIVAMVPSAVIFAGAVDTDNDTTFLDTFEDGDVDEYSNLTSSGSSFVSAEFNASTQDAASGTFSGRINLTTDGNGNDASAETELDISPEIGQDENFNLSGFLRIKGVGLEDIYVTIEDSNGETLGLKFEDDQKGEVRLIGTVVNDSSSVTDVGQGSDNHDFEFTVVVDQQNDNITLYGAGTKHIESDMTTDMQAPFTIKYRYGKAVSSLNTEYWGVFDDIRVEKTDTNTVSGTVTDQNGDPLTDATIKVNTTATKVTTNATGFYSIDLPDGTHELTASKDEYDDNSTVVTVSGSDVTDVNFTLGVATDLTLNVPSHMWQNQVEDYTVTLEYETNGTEVDVTDDATVQSADPTNLSVDSFEHNLESTSDLSFNGEIRVNATYDGETVSKNVTVANKSVENVDLMQNAADMTAALWGDPVHPETGDRQGGSQLTMRILFIAILIGAAIATWASAFAGIGAVVVVVAMGWFMGWVGDGMALVTVFTGLFIGLNVAANIDYSVRR